MHKIAFFKTSPNPYQNDTEFCLSVVTLELVFCIAIVLHTHQLRATAIATPTTTAAKTSSHNY